jgi:elongation factor G
MTLIWQNDPSHMKPFCKGMGDQHIDVASIARRPNFRWVLTTMNRVFHIAKELPRKASAQYRHKKQSGGGSIRRSAFRIEPLPSADFEFTDELVGMNLSKSYLPPDRKRHQGHHGTRRVRGLPDEQCESDRV